MCNVYVRGIAANWKHVLGYWFLGETTTTPNIRRTVMECIDAATEAGLIIKAIICDQGHPINI